MKHIDILEIQKNIEEKRQILGKKFENFLLFQFKNLLKEADQFLGTRFFVFLSVSFIFLLSIFLRSRMDIGCDSGFYLSITTRLAQGGRYYYDFFESNFPLSFYIHFIPYYVAKFFGLNHMIVADYFVNILGLASIIFSARILQGSHLHKTHQHIIITAFAIGFFLRIGTLEFGEFLTKTSFYLILAFPYIAYSFARPNPLCRNDMIWRGVLAGLMPCLKPHYIILPMVIEISRFWERKSFKFFLELDKLLMVLIGVGYLVFMIRYTPEFLTYMPSMWSEFYSVYEIDSFMSNLRIKISSHLIILGIFLIFFRLTLSPEDKVLLLVGISSAMILVIEALPYALDQEACFFGLIIAVILKFFYDFVTSNKVDLSNSKFLLAFLFILSFIDSNYHSVMSVIHFWWLLLPIVLFFTYKKVRLDVPDFSLRNYKKEVMQFIVIFIAVMFVSFSVMHNAEIYAVISVMVLFSFVYVYEKCYRHYYREFSYFFVIIQFCLLFYLLSRMFFSISSAYQGSNFRQSPNAITDGMIEYSKAHSLQGEQVVVLTKYLIVTHPTMNYLGGLDNSTLVPYLLFDNVQGKKDYRDSDTLQYAMQNLKNRIADPNTKVLFIDKSLGVVKTPDRCVIGFLEYYLQDPEFRDIFLENYEYSGAIVNVHEKSATIEFVAKDRGDFSDITPSQSVIVDNYEVYMRKKHDQ